MAQKIQGQDGKILVLTRDLDRRGLLRALLLGGAGIGGALLLSPQPVFAGPPVDDYYVLTKLDAGLVNSQLHPNSGNPNYNVTHNFSDLAGAVSLAQHGDLSGDSLTKHKFAQISGAALAAQLPSDVAYTDVVQTFTSKQKIQLGTDLTDAFIVALQAGGVMLQVDTLNSKIGIGGAPSPTNEKLYLVSGAMLFDNAQDIRWKDSGGTVRQVLLFDSGNQMHLQNPQGGLIVLGQTGTSEGVRMQRLADATSGSTLKNSRDLQFAASRFSGSATTFGLAMRAVPYDATRNVFKLQFDVGVSPDLQSGLLTSGIATKTTAYTMVLDDHIILADGTTAAFTVTLPTAANKGQHAIIIKKDSSINAITVSRAGSDTIEGANTKSLATQYSKLHLVADGTSTWYDLASGLV